MFSYGWEENLEHYQLVVSYSNRTIIMLKSSASQKNCH